MEAGIYNSIEEFAEDVRLTFDNALVYNSPKSDVAAMAKTLLDLFEKEYAKVEAGDIKGRGVTLALALFFADCLSVSSPRSPSAGLTEQGKRMREDTNGTQFKKKKIDAQP